MISKKNLTEDKENILLPSLIYSAITPTSRHQDSPPKKRTKEKLLEALTYLHRQSVFGLASCWLWFKFCWIQICVVNKQFIQQDPKSSCRHHSVFSLNLQSKLRAFDFGVSRVCWLFIFKVTEPSSIPYRTHSACARAAYPDPPPVIPVPDTGVAEVTHLPSPLSREPNRLSSEPGSASGPKCFQVLGLSPSLLQNPML